MKGLPPELVYVLLFGAFLLFNVVLKKLARKQRPDDGQGDPDLDPDEIPEEVWRGEPEPAFVMPTTAPTIAPRQPSRPPPARPPATRRRFTRASLLGNRQQVQDAFVVATILGHCRADEPHEVA